MRLLLFLLAVLFSSQISFSQSLDVGFDIKINQNFLHNRNLEYEIDYAVAWPRLSLDDQYQMIFPNHNYALVDDFGDSIFVRYTDLEISNNFEIPICFRLNFKSNWFLDLKLTTGRYTMDYLGGLYQDEEYYFAQYGTIDDYLSANSYNSYSPLVGPDMNNATAYFHWFNEQVRDDPWSQATVRYQEEVKYRSIYLGGGYKFLSHKKLNPYVYLGARYNLAISNFSRTHLEIEDKFQGFTSIVDQSNISEELPKFGKQAIGFRADLGVSFYRYRLGFAADIMLNIQDDEVIREGNYYHDYTSPGFGFWTFGLYLGADLQSFDLNSKSSKKEVYQEEYSGLASKLDKNRKWAFTANVDIPVVSNISTYSPFSILDYNEI